MSAHIYYRLTGDGQTEVAREEAVRAISCNYQDPRAALEDSDEQHPVISGLACYWRERGGKDRGATMTNPYFMAAEQELFCLREDDPAASNGATMIVRSLLAIAWELKQAREEREQSRPGGATYSGPIYYGDRGYTWPSSSHQETGAECEEHLRARRER